MEIAKITEFYQQKRSKSNIKLSDCITGGQGVGVITINSIQQILSYELCQLLYDPSNGLEIRSRIWKGTAYHDCFSGYELVSTILQLGFTDNRKFAREIANKLLKENYIKLLNKYSDSVSHSASSSFQHAEQPGNETSDLPTNERGSSGDADMNFIDKYGVWYQFQTEEVAGIDERELRNAQEIANVEHRTDRCLFIAISSPAGGMKQKDIWFSTNCVHCVSGNDLINFLCESMKIIRSESIKLCHRLLERGYLIEINAKSYLSPIQQLQLLNEGGSSLVSAGKASEPERSTFRDSYLHFYYFNFIRPLRIPKQNEEKYSEMPPIIPQFEQKKSKSKKETPSSSIESFSDLNLSNHQLVYLLSLMMDSASGILFDSMNISAVNININTFHSLNNPSPSLPMASATPLQTPNTSLMQQTSSGAPNSPAVATNNHINLQNINLNHVKLYFKGASLIQWLLNYFTNDLDAIRFANFLVDKKIIIFTGNEKERKSLTKNNQNLFKFSKKILHFYESMKSKLPHIIQAVESQPIRNSDKFPFIRSSLRRDIRSNTISSSPFHHSSSSFPTSSSSFPASSIVSGSAPLLPPIPSNVNGSGPILFERKPGSSSSFDENHPTWKSFKILQILLDIYHPSSGIKRSSVSINKQSVQLFSGLQLFSFFSFSFFFPSPLLFLPPHSPSPSPLPSSPLPPSSFSVLSFSSSLFLSSPFSPPSFPFLLPLYSFSHLPSFLSLPLSLSTSSPFPSPFPLLPFLPPLSPLSLISFPFSYS